MHFLICCSFAKPCPTLWPLVLQPTRLLYPKLSPKSWFTYTESMMLSNRLILCHLLLLPSVFPSIRVFFNESALCIRWPKYWNFSNNPNMICSNSCPLSWRCHATISSSVALFSFCPQSFPASGSFPVSRPLASGGQSIAASASASFFPMNIQGWFPLGFPLGFHLELVWSPCSAKDSQEFHPAPQFKNINS